MHALATVPKFITDQPPGPWEAFFDAMTPTIVAVAVVLIVASAVVVTRGARKFEESHREEGAAEFPIPVGAREFWPRAILSFLLAILIVPLCVTPFLRSSIVPVPSILISEVMALMWGLLLIPPLAWLVTPLLETPRRFLIGHRFIHVFSPGNRWIIPVEGIESVFQLRDSQRRLRGIEFNIRADVAPPVMNLVELFTRLHKRPRAWKRQVIFRPALGAEGERLLEQLALVGVRPETRLLLLDGEEPMAILRLFVDLVFCGLFLTASYFVALATLFWLNWTFFGGMNTPWSFVAAIPLALLYLCLFVVVGPVRGWLWKSLQMIFVRGPFNVELAEGFATPGSPALTTTTAYLEPDGDSLLFHFLGRRLRIRRRDLTTLSIRSLGWGNRTLFGYRYLSHPIVIQWLTEEAAEHCILVHASCRSSLGSDRWSTDRLYAYLCRWRDGDGADLGPLRLVTRPRAFPAFAIFAAIWLLIPLVHNHLLLSRVRTGDWQPNISGPLEPEAVRRVGSSVPAADPRSVLVLEAGHPLSVQRWWRLDLETSNYSFLSFETDVMLSQPGAPTSLLTASLHPYIFQLLPPGLPFRMNRLLINIEDGNIREAEWLPDSITTPQGALSRNGWVAMPGLARPTGLYSNSPHRSVYPLNTLRDFASRGPLAPLSDEDFTIITRPSPGGESLPVPLVDVDIYLYAPNQIADEPRGTVRGAGSTGLIFFPGGTSLVAFWQILDLQTGEVRTIQLPEGIEPTLQWWGRSLNVFPQGENLGMRVCLEIDGKLRNEVWLVRPTGECEVLGTLADNEYLLSVDEQRWLIARVQQGTDPSIYLRSSEDPGKDRFLFEGNADWRYSLVRDQDRILAGEGGGGLLLRDFDGAVVRRFD
ncbi:hypothetical protein GC173_04665 [bacterium]|nr:hypothetical protein [bacterium]